MEVNGYNMTKQSKSRNEDHSAFRNKSNGGFPVDKTQPNRLHPCYDKSRTVGRNVRERNSPWDAQWYEQSGQRWPIAGEFTQRLPMLETLGGQMSGPYMESDADAILNNRSFLNGKYSQGLSAFRERLYYDPRRETLRTKNHERFVTDPMMDSNSMYGPWLRSSNLIFAPNEEKIELARKKEVLNFKNEIYEGPKNYLRPTSGFNPQTEPKSLFPDIGLNQLPSAKESMVINDHDVFKDKSLAAKQIKGFKFESLGSLKSPKKCDPTHPLLTKRDDGQFFEGFRSPSSITNLKTKSRAPRETMGLPASRQRDPRRLNHFPEPGNLRPIEAVKQQKFWDYGRLLNECHRMEDLLSMMQREKNDMDAQIIIVTKQKNELQKRISFFESNQKKERPFSPETLTTDKGFGQNLIINVAMNFEMENSNMMMGMGMRPSSTTATSKKPFRKMANKIHHTFSGESLQKPDLKKRNLIQRNSNEKSKRVPLVLGDASYYVLVKFNREKKREKFKFSIPIEGLFPTLQLVFRKVLWNERVNQEELNNLTTFDKDILQAILKKKKLISGTNMCFDEEPFADVVSRTGVKRNEENLKCVFKYALKFLRTQFRRSHSEFRFRQQNIHMKHKNLIDLGFYTFYFGEIADHLDWPISKFFHPKVFAGNPGLNANIDEPELRPKTINKEYIDNLKRSQAFIRDFKNYLENKFEITEGVFTGIIDQYKKVSKEKMLQKLDKWHKLFIKNGKDKGLELVLKELNENDKCKLPWSVTEMKKAVEDTNTHFEIE